MKFNSGGNEYRKEKIEKEANTTSKKKLFFMFSCAPPFNLQRSMAGAEVGFIKNQKKT
jgi:hypothetical protein